MKIISYGLILVGLSVLWFLRDADPLLKLAAASLLLLFFVKAAALLWQLSDGLKPKSKLGMAIYILALPFIMYTGFEERAPHPPPETGIYFLRSWIMALAGCTLLLISAYFGRGKSLVFNYTALISLLMIVHMGFIESMTDGIRLLGFSPPSLFNRPYLSSSLKDFWSARWNRAFVDMNKLFIFRPLHGRIRAGVLVFGIFLVSGILHELAISYPVGIRWGFPLAYFAFQGLGVLIERRAGFPRAFVMAWVLLPLPVLFPPPFVNFFLGRLCATLYNVIFTLSGEQVLHYGFFLGAVLQAMVLLASVQVPARLGWRKELQSLRPLNRKVFWTYGAYILSVIVFMAGVSFYLSGLQVFGSGELLWAIFISLFWLARIAIDFLYMKHDDWPHGPLFDVGHVCLATLFISMSALFIGLACEMAVKVYG